MPAETGSDIGVEVATFTAATSDQRHPHPPPAVVSGPQQRDFSSGAQQPSCSLGAQHAVSEREVTPASVAATAGGAGAVTAV